MGKKIILLKGICSKWIVCELDLKCVEREGREKRREVVLKNK